MGLNKKLVTGVLIGVLVTLGVQWGVGMYERSVALSIAQEFATGYQNASNKESFVRGYNFSQAGVSVSLNTSSAFAASCPSLQRDLDGVYAMFLLIDQSSAYNINDPQSMEEFRRMDAILVSQIKDIRDRQREAGCLGGDDLEISN